MWRLRPVVVIAIADRWRGRVCLALAMATVGSTVVASAIAAGKLDPFAAALLRFGVAAPILVAICLIRGERWPSLSSREWLTLAFQSAVGSLGYTVALVAGLALRECDRRRDYHRIDADRDGRRRRPGSGASAPADGFSARSGWPRLARSWWPWSAGSGGGGRAAFTACCWFSPPWLARLVSRCSTNASPRANRAGRRGDLHGGHCVGAVDPAWAPRVGAGAGDALWIAPLRLRHGLLWNRCPRFSASGCSIRERR